MSPFHSKAFVFFAVSVMVISGAAVYLSVSAVSGDHAFVPVQPHTNPVSFNPAETVDSTGSAYGTGPREYTSKIGNTTWCASGSELHSILDLGQSIQLCFGGPYNQSSYTGPSGGILLNVCYSSELVKQYHTNFGYYLTTYDVTCTFTPSSAGTYKWQLAVCVDPSIKEIDYSAFVSFTVESDPTVSTPTATPSHNPLETPLPVSITFSTTESGGASPLSYQWDINGTGVSGATSTTFTHIFSGYASYTITVNVTDATGYKVTSTALVEVIYPPLSVSLSVSPNPADIGESVKLTASASGGSGTYSGYVFSYSVNGTPYYIHETTNTHSISFSSSGNYPMNVSVTDSAGYTAYSLNTTEVISNQLAAVISSNVSETEVGFGVEFMSSVAGGIPPYTYSWSVSDNGSATITGTGSDINYTDPTEAGTLSAKLTVKDNQTGVYTAYKNITVLPDVKLVNFSLSNSVRWVVSESGICGA